VSVLGVRLGVDNARNGGGGDLGGVGKANREDVLEGVTKLPLL
jgi:hypothetical protein